MKKRTTFLFVKGRQERKKIMKKLLVVLVMLLVLVGCGSNDAGKQEVEAGEPWEANLIEKGKIIVGTSPDYPPFETLDDAGKIVGFDIDVFEAVVSKLDGYEVEWQAMEFDTIVSAVQTGTVDFGVSGFSYDPEKQVLFTDTYYDAGQTVLVLKDSGIKKASDLDGKEVAVQLGTTCAEAAEEYLNANLSTGTDVGILVNALKQGQYDGVVLDTVVAENYVKNDDVFTLIDEPLVTDAYSMITASENTELMNKINGILKEFVQTDEYQALIDKWGM